MTRSHFLLWLSFVSAGCGATNGDPSGHGPVSSPSAGDVSSTLPEKSVNGESCASSADCAGALRCIDQVCVCQDSAITGIDCDQCVDDRMAPPACTLCLPQYSGATCSECTNPNMELPGCNTCKAPFAGATCSSCANPNMEPPNCVHCKPEYSGAACEKFQELGTYQVKCDNGMCLVPSGPFAMGCNADVDDDCNDSEYPQHEVDIPDFWIDELETSAGDYWECVAAGPCNPSEGQEKAWGNDCSLGYNTSYEADFPIVCVSYKDAKTYCKWRDKRLCSEAEWEKAARGTDGRKYPWGNSDPTCELAVYSEDACGQSGPTLPGSRPAGRSPYGVLDMSGNVGEFISDCWHDDYTDAPLTGVSWDYDCGDYWSLLHRGSPAYYLATGPYLRASWRGAYQDGCRSGTDRNYLAFCRTRAHSVTLLS